MLGLAAFGAAHGFTYVLALLLGGKVGRQRYPASD